MNEDVRVLRDEIETLREENRQLRDVIAPATAFPLEWRLTHAQERIFAALNARESVSYDALCLVSSNQHCVATEGSLKSQVCLLRKKIAPFGYRIKPVWDRGYRLIKPPVDEVTDVCVRDLRRTSQAMHSADARAAS